MKKTTQTPDYMRVTKAQFARTVKLWSEYAGETVTIDPTFLGSVIGEPIMAFGSELGCFASTTERRWGASRTLRTSKRGTT